MPENTASATETFALLDRLKKEMPEMWNQALVVGKWVWLEFSVPPLPEIRAKLKELGFHWNKSRKCWQHPCGIHKARSGRDPRSTYQVLPASALELNEAPATAGSLSAKEYKIVTLRECPLPETLRLCDDSDKAAEYWRLTIATNPYFNPECECFAVVILN